MYGALNLSDTVHVVRVKNTQTYLLQDSTSLEPIEVEFEDISAGTQVE